MTDFRRLKVEALTAAKQYQQQPNSRSREETLKAWDLLARCARMLSQHRGGVDAILAGNEELVMLFGTFTMAQRKRLELSLEWQSEEEKQAVIALCHDIFHKLYKHPRRAVQAIVLGGEQVLWAVTADYEELGRILDRDRALLDTYEGHPEDFFVQLEFRSAQMWLEQGYLDIAIDVFKSIIEDFRGSENIETLAVVLKVWKTYITTVSEGDYSPGVAVDILDEVSSWFENAPAKVRHHERIVQLVTEIELERLRLSAAVPDEPEYASMYASMYVKPVLWLISTVARQRDKQDDLQLSAVFDLMLENYRLSKRAADISPQRWVKHFLQAGRFAAYDAGDFSTAKVLLSECIKRYAGVESKSARLMLGSAFSDLRYVNAQLATAADPEIDKLEAAVIERLLGDAYELTDAENWAEGAEVCAAIVAGRIECTHFGIRNSVVRALAEHVWCLMQLKRYVDVDLVMSNITEVLAPDLRADSDWATNFAYCLRRHYLALDNLKRHHEALKVIDKFLQLWSESVDPRLRQEVARTIHVKLDLEYQLGLNAQALESARQGAEFMKSQDETLIVTGIRCATWVAEILNTEGQYQQALDYVQQVIDLVAVLDHELAPELLGYLYLQRGKAAMGLDQPRQAIADFETVVRGDVGGGSEKLVERCERRLAAARLMVDSESRKGLFGSLWGRK